MGLLKTDLQYEHTEAGILILNGASDDDIARINAHVQKLCDDVRAELDADGIAPAAQELKIIAECRYQGQGFELRADFPTGPLTQANKQTIIDSFHDAHERDYGYAYREAEVELITLRVIGSASVRRIEIPRIRPTDGSSIDRALMFVRPTTFDCGRTLDTPRYDRLKLYAGDRVPGPAILVQHNATTLVPPGYVAETLDFGNTRISKGA